MGALALGRLGIRTILIDRRTPDAIYGNADGIQPGTIEVWESYGLRKRLSRDGHIAVFPPENSTRTSPRPSTAEGTTANARSTYRVFAPGFIADVGIIYDSLLTPSLAPSAKITPGERLSPVAILRLCDWYPANVHDLIKSDGTFKLVLFPGTAAALNETLPGLLARFTGDLMQGGKTKKMVKISTVLKGKKTELHWTDVLEVVRDRFTIFVDDMLGYGNGAEMDMSRGDLYGTYGVEEGCAVLVRPDSHVSMVIGLDASGAVKAAKFLVAL